MTYTKTRNSKNNDQKITKAFEKIVSGPEVRRLNKNAIGIDIGTSKTVFVTNNKRNSNNTFLSQLNAFLSVEYSKFTEDILRQNKIKHIKWDKSLFVYGDGAQIFANMLNTETRRPLRKGLLNSQEANAVEILKGILEDLIPDTVVPNSPLCFSIPGAPVDSATDLIYHESILKKILDTKGFNSKSINEGMAVVFSELEDENFTGFGISAGGGMCNVCLSYLSIPHISFSITKGGDYIDDAVASVTSEVNTRVRDIKEHDLDLLKKPDNEIEEALQIYYDDLIKSLVTEMKKYINKTSRIPKVENPIPIVLSGGTAKPNGFKERFETVLHKIDFPIEISEVRMARDPINATARGALIAAMHEG